MVIAMSKEKETDSVVKVLQEGDGEAKRNLTSTVGRHYFDTRFCPQMAPLVFKWSEETTPDSLSRKYTIFRVEGDRYSPVCEHYGVRNAIGWMEAVLYGVSVSKEIRALTES